MKIMPSDPRFSVIDAEQQKLCIAMNAHIHFQARLLDKVDWERNIYADAIRDEIEDIFRLMELSI